MNEDTSTLILEMLREHRELHRKMLSELADMKHHTLALRETMSLLARDDAQICQMLAGQAARLDGVEDRLGPSS